MLQNVTERWQRTGTWAEICQKKVIICEPKNSAEFEASMRHFYEVTIDPTFISSTNRYFCDIFLCL
jgi:hypothetical protein